MKEAMLKSDYSENYANASTQLKKTKGFNKVMKPILDELKKEQQKIISEMRKRKIGSEKYKELAEVFEKISKQIQLREGKPTEITDDYSNLTNEELEQRLKQIRGGEDNKGVRKKKTA